MFNRWKLKWWPYSNTHDNSPAFVLLSIQLIQHKSAPFHDQQINPGQVIYKRCTILPKKLFFHQQMIFVYPQNGIITHKAKKCSGIPVRRFRNTSFFKFFSPFHFSHCGIRKSIHSMLGSQQKHFLRNSVRFPVSMKFRGHYLPINLLIPFGLLCFY